MRDPDFRLLTRKTDLGETRLDILPRPEPLADGEVLLGLERFSLSAATLAYPGCGEALGAWDLFPTGIDGHGLMPVWGFADVLQSRAAGIEVGARVFGCFPMAAVLKVKAGHVGPDGFLDVSLSRQRAPDHYNRYAFRAAAGAACDPGAEDGEALFQPLFAATRDAFDALSRQAFFGAGHILVSTVSRGAGSDAIWWLATVSDAEYEANMASMGYCDAVYAYEEVERRPADEGAVYLDLAGDPELRRRVSAHFGDRLIYDCPIPSGLKDLLQWNGPASGSVHASFAADEGGPLPGCYEGFVRDQQALFRHVVAPGDAWIRIGHHQGWAAAAKILRALADGTSDPDDGAIVRLTR